MALALVWCLFVCPAKHFAVRHEIAQRELTGWRVTRCMFPKWTFTQVALNARSGIDSEIICIWFSLSYIGSDKQIKCTWLSPDWPGPELYEQFPERAESRHHAGARGPDCEIMQAQRIQSQIKVLKSNLQPEMENWNIESESESESLFKPKILGILTC